MLSRDTGLGGVCTPTGVVLWRGSGGGAHEEGVKVPARMRCTRCVRCVNAAYYYYCTN